MIPVSDVRPIHFVEVVWGEAYCENFLDLSLPTQLSAGNLAGLRRRGIHRYRIFTSTADEERIRGAASFKALEALMDTDIVTFDAATIPVGDDKYPFMTRLHQRALSDARSAGAVIALLFPDMLAADGAFQTLESLTDRAAVMIAAPRLNLQTVGAELRRLRSPTGALTLPPRELVALGMRHLHPVTVSLIWGTRWFNTYPAAIYWPMEGCGMIARYFHMHPLLVDPALIPQDVGDRMTNTIDGDLLDSLMDDPDRIHVVTDSDDLLCFEMSNAKIVHGMADRREVSTVDDIAYFVRWYASPLHQAFGRRSIHFHACDRGELVRFAALDGDVARLMDDAFARAPLLPDRNAAVPAPAPQPQPEPIASTERIVPPPRKRGGSVRAAFRALERTVRRATWRRGAHTPSAHSAP